MNGGGVAKIRGCDERAGGGDEDAYDAGVKVSR